MFLHFGVALEGCLPNPLWHVLYIYISDTFEVRAGAYFGLWCYRLRICYVAFSPIFVTMFRSIPVRFYTGTSTRYIALSEYVYRTMVVDDRKPMMGLHLKILILCRLPACMYISDLNRAWWVGGVRFLYHTLAHATWWSSISCTAGHGTNNITGFMRKFTGSQTGWWPSFIYLHSLQ